MADGAQHIGFILGSKVMFELETAIEKWKEDLIGDGTINMKETLELESHLRDSIVALQTQSLSEQESFLVATRRLGRPTELQQEFEKNNPARRWRHRLFWMLVGSLGLKAVGSTAAAMATIVGTAMAAIGFAGSTSAITMIVVMFSLWIAVFEIGFCKRQQLGFSGESLPSAWLIALGATITVAPLVSAFGRVWQSTLVTPSWFGEVMFYSNNGRYALNLCILLFCFVAMWQLNDRDALTAE